MAEGFASIDRTGRLVEMNAAGLRITQRTASNVIGKPNIEAFPQLIGTPTEALYARVMETGVAESHELAYVAPNGKAIWAEVRAYRAMDGGLAVFFRDVTARRQAEENLKDADRRKDEFLAMLAHELRNPLAPVRSAAELLSVAELDEARLRQVTAIISRQVNHMTGLIDDLLDVSRVTRGLVILNKEILDIREIITEAIEQIRPAMEKGHHEFSADLPVDLAMVWGDRIRLVQILANLLATQQNLSPSEDA